MNIKLIVSAGYNLWEEYSQDIVVSTNVPEVDADVVGEMTFEVIDVGTPRIKAYTDS
jgi:hypothetical protein